MSLDIPPARPGADPARPHCDLRLPPLSQASRAVGAPSWTAEAALLIASLHRAAEVAFFTWRAQQPDGGATPAAPAAHSEPEAASSRTAVSSLQAAQALDAAAVRRRAISAALQHDLASAMPLRDAASRSTGAGMIDISDDDAETRSVFQLPPGLASDWLSHLIAEADDESDNDGDAADDSVVRAAMGGTSDGTRERDTARRTAGSGPRHDVVDAAFRALSGLSTGESEHDVWQRMIRDLALPSSYPPAPLARMASARARELTIPRQLPHPVWARRYPGAAGDWLRAELSRRAAGHRERTQSGPRRVNQHTESRAARASAAPESEMRSAVEVLQETTLPLDERGAVTIRTTTVGNVLRARAQASASAARSNRGHIYTSSSRPARRSIESMTASLGLERHDQRRGADQASSSPPSSDRTEEIARSERSAAAAARVADLVQQQRVRRGQALSEARAGVASTGSEAPARSRAVRGGLDYLARLRELDASSSGAAPAEDRTEASAYAHARPVFPWYSASAHEEPPVVSSSSWFEAARERQSAQAEEERRAAEAREAARRRYGFMPPDDVDEVAPCPRLRTEDSQSNHAQRQRNRIATVVAERDSEVPSMRLAAEGWTLIDPAANTVPSAADEATGARDDGRWLFDGPAQPSRRFSASPMQLEPTLSPPPIISGAQWAAGHGGAPAAPLDDPRALRRPRRLASLTTEDVTAAARSSGASSPSSAGPSAGSAFGHDRAGPGILHALRHAEDHRTGTPRQAVSSSPPSTDAFLRLNAADAWANSEAERDFQSRLDASDAGQRASAAAPAPLSPRVERAARSDVPAREDEREADVQHLRDLSLRFNREMSARREELREAETRIRAAVARSHQERVQELDEIFAEYGGFGRVGETPAAAHDSTSVLESAPVGGSGPEQRTPGVTAPDASAFVERHASRDPGFVQPPSHPQEPREAAAHAVSQPSQSSMLESEAGIEVDDKDVSATGEAGDARGPSGSSVS